MICEVVSEGHVLMSGDVAQAALFAEREARRSGSRVDVVAVRGDGEPHRWMRPAHLWRVTMREVALGGQGSVTSAVEGALRGGGVRYVRI